MTLQRLEVTGSNEALQRTWGELLKPVEGWDRDVDSERNLRSGAGSAEDVVLRSPKGFEPTSRVCVMKRDRGLVVAIFVYPPATSISERRHNELLRRFFDEVIAPISGRTDALASMSKANEDLEDWMAPEPAGRLRFFNKYSYEGESWTHSMAREAWFEFLISAHRTGARMEPWQLREWLKENGWSGRKKAHSLEQFVDDYRFALELLKANDN